MCLSFIAWIRSTVSFRPLSGQRRGPKCRWPLKNSWHIFPRPFPTDQLTIPVTDDAYESVWIRVTAVSAEKLSAVRNVQPRLAPFDSCCWTERVSFLKIIKIFRLSAPLLKQLSKFYYTCMSYSHRERQSKSCRVTNIYVLWW